MGYRTENNNQNAKPIVKWVGGKRQLIDELIERMPENYGSYYEPFFGGGALFFAVNPEKAVINDKNVQLTNVYEVVRDTPAEVLFERLTALQNEYNAFQTDEERLEYYYAKRAEYNECLKRDERSLNSACLFLLMNKVAFNGLYRENSKGLFNVSSSKRKSVTLFDEDNLLLVAEALKKCDILTGDFADAVKGAGAGDFVFIDSPYFETFTDYQKGGFGVEEHMRVHDLFRELSGNGAKCMLTNSNTDFIKDLYSDFVIEPVNVSRNINRNGNDRKGSEVIIRNYIVPADLKKIDLRQECANPEFVPPIQRHIYREISVA